VAKAFLTVHGARRDASSWAQAVRHIESRGHKASAVNLPGGKIASGEKRPSLADYKQTVLGAIAAAGALAKAAATVGANAADAARVQIARYVAPAGFLIVQLYLLGPGGRIGLSTLRE
jgi:hypothetical protein